MRFAGGVRRNDDKFPTRARWVYCPRAPKEDCWICEAPCTVCARPVSTFHLKFWLSLSNSNRDRTPCRCLFGFPQHLAPNTCTPGPQHLAPAFPIPTCYMLPTLNRHRPSRPALAASISKEPAAERKTLPSAFRPADARMRCRQLRFLSYLSRGVPIKHAL